MPTISRFFVIAIVMSYNDHTSPHFHVKYAEHSAKIVIDTFEITEGQLPRRVLALVMEWAVLHRDELRENWQRARAGMLLNDI